MPASDHLAGDPVALLKQLIACPSVTPAEAGVMAVLEQALTPLGFAIRRLRFEGGGSYPVDNLYAVRTRPGPRLLFAGHTDVVPEGDAAEWTDPPFQPVERDGRIYGRGAADMKSGIAAFIAAAAQAVADGSAERGTLALAITNDEEADGVNGTARLMHWAAEHGETFDFAILGEPTSAKTLGDTIKIGRRGSFNARVVVTGKQGHVAYPEQAINPMPVLAALAVALKAEPIDAGTEHFQPSNLEVTSIDAGNATSNVIPNAGTLRFNIRFNDRWTPDTLRAWVAGRLQTVDWQGCTVELQVLGQPSSAFMAPTAGAVDILTRLIAERTGAPPLLSTGGGTSDARFIAPYGPVVELGLVGTSMHQVDEQVSVADLHGLSALYAAFIRAFFAAN